MIFVIYDFRLFMIVYTGSFVFSHLKLITIPTYEKTCSVENSLSFLSYHDEFSIARPHL